MTTCNINVILALSSVSQVSAMDAVSTSQLPATTDMYTANLLWKRGYSLRYLGYTVLMQEIKY